MTGIANLPKDKDLAVHVINGTHAKEQLEVRMGGLGKLLGGGDEKPGNIAAVVLFIAMIALAIVLLVSVLKPEAQLREAITGFFGIITTTIGYIFGRKTSE